MIKDRCHSRGHIVWVLSVILGSSVKLVETVPMAFSRPLYAHLVSKWNGQLRVEQLACELHS